MTEPVVVESKAVPIKGQQITLKKLTDGQITLLLRESRRMQRDDVTGAQGMEALERVDRILHSVIVFDEDKKTVDDLLETGELTLKELTREVMNLFASDEAEKPKVVRRGRPPKHS